MPGSSFLQLGRGRVIQSVGTPYSGTPIAGGLIPELASILGIGCGSITDLTVEGALRWQREIPPSKQKEVFYYTTQVSFQQNLNWMYIRTFYPKTLRLIHV